MVDDAIKDGTSEHRRAARYSQWMDSVATSLDDRGADCCARRRPKRVQSESVQEDGSGMPGRLSAARCRELAMAWDATSNAEDVEMQRKRSVSTVATTPSSQSAPHVCEAASSSTMVWSRRPKRKHGAESTRQKRR